MELYKSSAPHARTPNYYGIIYKIRNKFNNKIRIGRYKGSLVARWGLYNRHAQNVDRYKDHFSNAIRKYNGLGYDLSFGDNEVFDFEVLAVIPHGQNSEQLYYELEEYFVAHYKARQPNMGYNILKGGKDEILSGPEHYGWINIPFEELDQAIWWSIRITGRKGVVSNYLAKYFGVGRKKISSMIGYYYKKVENGVEVPMSYQEVRDQKLAIAMEKYWKLGYHGKEFAKFFSMEHLADISRKTTFNEWSMKFFGKIPLDARNAFLDDSIIHCVRMGLTLNQIDEALPGVGLATIKSRLQKYGGIRGLRKTLYEPILQNLLTADLYDFEISEILFIEWEEVERLTLKLWGMTSDKARRFFKSHHLGGFVYDSIL